MKYIDNGILVYFSDTEVFGPVLRPSTLCDFYFFTVLTNTIVSVEHSNVKCIVVSRMRVCVCSSVCSLFLLTLIHIFTVTVCGDVPSIYLFQNITK